MDISIGVATEPVAGQLENGDKYLIEKSSLGVLICVVDGLGHGLEASHSADTAISTTKVAFHNLAFSREQLSAYDIVTQLVTKCNDELVSTRGAAMLMIYIDNHNLTWLGVGNVAGIVWQREHLEIKPFELYSQNGIVGYNLPKLKPNSIRLQDESLFALATDGISDEFCNITPQNLVSAQCIADDIFKKYRKEKDDSLILVVKYNEQ